MNWGNSCGYVVAGQANGNLLLICMKIEWLCSKAEAVQIGMGDVSIHAAEITDSGRFKHNACTEDRIWQE